MDGQIDDKLVDDLKLKHPGVPLAAVFAVDGTTLVFRRPTRLEYDRWFDKAAENKSQAARELAQSTLVHPGRDAMIAALDAEPALLMRAGGILDVVTELAGIDRKGEISKKL